jgi:hypothetical protein
LNTLEASFHEFMASLRDAESIDSLPTPVGFERSQRADYLLDERRVIVELKSLESDPIYKIEKILEPRRDSEDFPQFFGEAELATVLSKLPDGEQLNRKIALHVTRVVEDAFRNAKRQIAATREMFGLPSSSGALILLNHDIDVLSPTLVGYRCKHLLDNFDPADEFAGSINCVWIIQMTHHAGVHETKLVIPSLFAESGKFPLPEAARLRIERLAVERASFHGIPFITRDKVSDPDKLEAFSEFRLSKMPEKRHEKWRADYRARPYLSVLADDALLKHSSRMFELTLPFLVGEIGSNAPTRSMNEEPEAYEEIMSGWTHCLTEMNFRLLDMRRFTPYLKRLQPIYGNQAS